MSAFLRPLNWGWKGRMRPKLLEGSWMCMSGLLSASDDSRGAPREPKAKAKTRRRVVCRVVEKIDLGMDDIRHCGEQWSERERARLSSCQVFRFPTSLLQRGSRGCNPTGPEQRTRDVLFLRLFPLLSLHLQSLVCKHFRWWVQPSYDPFAVTRQ